MLRLRIIRDEGLYYWEITRNREVICAGTQGYDTEEKAEAEARIKWFEYTGNWK